MFSEAQIVKQEILNLILRKLHQVFLFESTLCCMDHIMAFEWENTLFPLKFLSLGVETIQLSCLLLMEKHIN